MPKNKVSDLISDQEISFARLVLSGGVTDRQAAETAGLNPDSAAHTKAKPRVRAYMLDHRAAVEQQLVQQEADLSRLPRLAVGRAVEGQHRLNLDREQVLDRLWEIANLSPEMTRGSITGQVKAIAMIIAMENFIPDRRAVSAEKKSAPAPAQIHASVGPTRQQATTHVTTNDLQPSPAQQEDEHARPGSVGAPPNPGPSQSTSANRITPSEAPKHSVPLFGSVPDLGVPLPIKNPFVYPR
jgi:hypothetical protein